MPLSAEKTVGEVAAAFPAAARVLEKHHIDYYSERSHPFREACRVAGVSAEDVLEEVRRTSQDWRHDRREDHDDWTAAPLRDLIEYLVNAHQVWRNKDLPWIDHLLERAASVDKENRSLALLRRVFLELRDDLEQHLQHEEENLFPTILKLEQAKGSVQDVSLRNPLQMIEQDHEIDAELWDELREIAYGYVAGEDAPQSIRALYHELSKLETAVHEHTHLENNVLFPRVVRLLQPAARRVGQS